MQPHRLEMKARPKPPQLLLGGPTNQRHLSGGHLGKLSIVSLGTKELQQTATLALP